MDKIVLNWEIPINPRQNKLLPHHCDHHNFFCTMLGINNLWQGTFYFTPQGIGGRGIRVSLTIIDVTITIIRIIKYHYQDSAGLSSILECWQLRRVWTPLAFANNPFKHSIGQCLLQCSMNIWANTANCKHYWYTCRNNLYGSEGRYHRWGGGLMITLVLMTTKMHLQNIAACLQQSNLLRSKKREFHIS